MATTSLKIENGQAIFDDIEFLKTLKDGHYQVKIQNMDYRTNRQNNSLHKLFTITADALNDAGYSVQFVLNYKQNETIEKVFDWLLTKVGQYPAIASTVNKAKERALDYRDAGVPWTMELVKESIWRPIQKAITGKTSTTKLTKDEVDKVYEVYNTVLARYGIHVPFPSID